MKGGLNGYVVYAVRSLIERRDGGLSIKPFRHWNGNMGIVMPANG